MKRGVLLGLALFSGACHHAARPEAVSPAAETKLRVDNQNLLDMDIYVLERGLRMRIGTVNGLSTKVFTLRPDIVGIGNDLRFELRPIGGGGSPRTETILVHPGDEVELRIPPS